MNKPPILKLSIITINLNNKAGLQKTMSSVLSQTFTDYEYIIIDGGSNDGSLDAIKENADKITYWVSEPDKGIYNAINKGIAKAKGEYCLFLNGGDSLVHTNSLNSLFKNSFDDDVVYWDLYLIKGTKKIKKYCQPQKLTASFFYSNTLNHQSCLIKRNLFEKYGLYDENYRIVSDWKFLTEVIIFRNASYKHINLTLTYFDFTGISTNSIDICSKERDEILSVIFPLWLRNDFKISKEIDTIVWMLKKSNFNPIIKFIFKSVNKIISYFWID